MTQDEDSLDNSFEEYGMEPPEENEYCDYECDDCQHYIGNDCSLDKI